MAAICEKKGFQVDILDALIQGWETELPTSHSDIVRVGLTDAEIKKAIEDFEPDLVGLSCMFSVQHKIYPHIFSIIKSVNPKIITVAGGAHVTVCQEDVLGDPNCDYIISGEAEESFVELIDAIQGKTTFESVDGLGWKNNGSELTIKPKLKWLDDLDQIPFPAYHYVKYHLIIISSLLSIISISILPISPRIIQSGGFSFLLINSRISVPLTGWTQEGGCSQENLILSH